MRATGAWELSGLFAAWESGGPDAVWAVLAAPVPELDTAGLERAVEGAAGSRSTRPVMAPVPGGTDGAGHGAGQGGGGGTRGGGMGQRRVLVHPSGFRMSPYADVGTPGEDVKKGTPPRKLWHSSPGSSGA